MYAMRLLAVGMVVGLLAVGSRADDKKPDEAKNTAKLIVGKWEATETDENTLPKGSIVEFTKDGKLKISFKIEEKEMTIEGTYKLEGDGFMMTIMEQTQKITIKKITATECHTTDKDGKIVNLTKKK